MKKDLQTWDYIMQNHEQNNITLKSLTDTYEFFNNTEDSYAVEEGKTLTIIDIINADVESSFDRKLKVANGATLNYIKLGKSTAKSTINYTNDIGEDATLNMTLIEVKSSTNTVRTALKNSSSSFNINGLLDLKDNDRVVYDVKTNHQNKSFSDISFKNLLNDKSSAKLDLFSIVEESASFSNAFQNSQTILLSDDSYISVAPHLEILIDELEASHGATCGDLDQDSIHYLESRGISEKDAEQILLNALKNEVYETLENEDLREYVQGLV